jgi:hypothetical protein
VCGIADQERIARSESRRQSDPIANRHRALDLDRQLGIAGPSRIHRFTCSGLR